VRPESGFTTNEVKLQNGAYHGDQEEAQGDPKTSSKPFLRRASSLRFKFRAQLGSSAHSTSPAHGRARRLTPFPTRLSRVCSSRLSSPTTHVGTSPSICRLSFRFLARAIGPARFSASHNTVWSSNGRGSKARLGEEKDRGVGFQKGLHTVFEIRKYLHQNCSFLIKSTSAGFTFS
jgi:hypothetical protein